MPIDQIAEYQVKPSSVENSAAVHKFESVYSPELVGGDVKFTDYNIVAAKVTV